jgi:hypothetical protein
MPKIDNYIGSVTPQIYIGLGGAGAAMVRRLYDHFHANRWWRQVRKPTTQFLVLDTDLPALDKNKTRPGVVTVALNAAPASERDDPLVAQIRGEFEARPSAAGAGQIRLESRLKLYASDREVRAKLDEAIGGALAKSNDFLAMASKQLDVQVFASLGGGTGSGALLPLAYLIRSRVDERGWKPRMVANLVHSGGIVDRVAELADYVLANSFAAIKEIEYLTSSEYAGKPIPFAWQRGADRPAQIDRAPFDILYLADRPERDLDRGDNIDLALADTAYVNLVTPAGGSEASARDNYSRFQRELLDKSHESSRSQFAAQGSPARYTLHWGTHGAAALTFPAEDFKRYCSLRWLADALERQFDATVQGAVTLSRKHASEDELRTLRVRKWSEALERRADEEWHEIQEARRREGLGEATGERPGLAGLVQKVSGLAVGDLAAGGAGGREKRIGQDDEASDCPANPPVAQQLIEVFVRNLAQSSTEQLSAPPTIAEYELSNGWERLAQLDRAYDDVRRRNDEVRRQLEERSKAGRWLTDLRQSLGETRALTATGVRYLLSCFRLGNPRLMLDGQPWKDLDQEILWREQRVKSLHLTTFASTQQEMEQAVKATFQGVEDGVRTEAATGWLTKALRKISGQSGFDTHGAVTTLAGILRQWHSQTNEYERLRTEVVILKGMREFVDQRLSHGQALAEQAATHATNLRATAEGIMQGVDRVTAAFTIGKEALEPTGASKAERQWGYLYEDLLAVQLDASLPDADVARVVDEVVLAAEGKRARFVPKTVISAVSDQLAKVADGVLETAIFGQPASELDEGQAGKVPAGQGALPGLTLDQLLLYEALYRLVPAEAMARGRDYAVGQSAAEQALAGQQRDNRTRTQVFRALHGAFLVADDPLHASVRKQVAMSIRSRLEGCSNLAMTLAKIDDSNTAKDDPALHQASVIADPRVLSGLKAMVPEADGDWRPITKLGTHIAANTDSGDGLWTWDDPHSLFFYRVRGVLSIDRFVGINESYDGYLKLNKAGGRRKPHPFHIDVGWEDALPEIAPKFHAEQHAQREEEFHVLVQALSSGLLHRPTARAHWTLTVKEFKRTFGSSDAGLVVAFWAEWREWTSAQRQLVTKAVAEAGPSKVKGAKNLELLKKAHINSTTDQPLLDQLIAQLQLALA